MARNYPRCAEKFKNATPFTDHTGGVVMEIERDEKGGWPQHKGKLWTGNAWLNVDQARDLRNWLDEVIP